MAIINNKHILFAATAALLVACGNDTVTDGSVQPTAKEEVPVTVAFADANVSTKSRAAGHDFAADDKLIAHIRHVKKGENDTYTEVGTNLSQTRTFTVGADPNMHQVGETSTYQTSAITPDQKLYWDDFSSNEGENDDNDIRTAGHGLQVEWGYCFNGNEASQKSTYTDEIQNYSISDQQGNGYQNYDLLWAKSQDMVSYLHGSSATDNTRDGLTIPYTHAMSKMTVKVTANLGFENSTDIFKDAGVLVSGLNTKGTFKASTATVTDASYTDETSSIQMHKASVSDDGKTATFECVFVPTTLKAVTEKDDVTASPLALIGDVDGNKYFVYLTQDIMKSWQLIGDNTTTKSGVNYQLNVTVKKTEVEVTAQLTDWTTVESDGDFADIHFDTDLTNVKPSEDLTDGTSYDIYRGTDTDKLAKVTTREYKTEDETSAWFNNPDIYWQDAKTNYYFRGLAKYESNKITSVGNDGTTANQGTDLLWATTAKHTGTNNSGDTETVAEGAAISPRTSHVPMTFSHAMSKVTFELKTTEDEASKVDLTDAKVTIPDLYTTGSIDVATGKITGSGDKSALENVASNTPSIVIPQKVNSKVITITLKDGTTYRYTLGDSETWEGGKSYTYTVTLQKEKIDFRSLIKEWTEQKGSGNATLDWD